MANNWVYADIASALSFDLGLTASVAASGVITLGLDTTVGTDATAGVEVTGGSYARQPLGPGAVTTVAPIQTSNTAVINFTSMPAVPSPGVQGVTIRDSATPTPVDKWRGALTTAKTTNAGDTLSFAVGSVVISVA